MHLDSTSVLSGYEMLGPIGRGSMGRVDLARQVGVDRLVAVKWLDMAEGPDRDALVARLRREASLMGKVSHPNVLTIHAFEVSGDGTPYLILEYIEAGDLRHVLRSRGRLTPAEARAILIPVCEAVGCLHDQGILHRDLKPENILMHLGRVPKVADFGIARPRGLDPEAALPDDFRPSGTEGYVAPEQRYGLEFDERADQYSLAAIAYELLTGEKPLGSFPRPSACNPEVDERMDRVLARGLSESPSQRYPTLAAFQDELAEALAPTPDAVRGRKRWRVARAVGVVVLGVGALWLATRPKPLSAPREPEVAAQVLPTATDSKTPTSDAPANAPSPASGDPAADAPSMEERLLRLWAYRLWQLQGAPEGEEGRRVEATNLETARRMVARETGIRANRLWIERGSRVHNDPVLDKAESERNWTDAQVELLRVLESGLPLPPESP
jgi:serine/threonine protein kinase